MVRKRRVRLRVGRGDALASRADALGGGSFSGAYTWIADGCELRSETSTVFGGATTRTRMV
ncbi:MAG: hypothetical protein AUH41_01605 [Gemmatimonadetes bacterium 13_1_40CM_66_11]|nr:MAG: hypothetical protein AUH41_01605 [Gemmatimonadetes bacterium 13_1_40CM_66_11]